MGKPIVKLIKGNRVLDLNDQSQYWLSQDFVPPAIGERAMFTRSDGDVFDTVEANRAFKFTVTVTGSSQPHVDRAVRSIVALLKTASDPAEPLYLVCGNDGLPEPTWGQTGAWMYYEVAYGSASLSDGYMVGVRRSSDIVVSIDLTLKPNGYGKRQRLAAAMGGVLDNRIGAADRRSRGVHVPEATTNLCTNPIFGNATYSANWTAGANLIEAKNTQPSFVAFGYASVRLTALASSNNTYTQSVTLAASTHTLSAYVKRPDAAAVTSADVQLTYNGTDRTTTFVALGDGWYVAEASVTGTAGAAACGVTVKGSRTIYVGAVQFEAKTFRTPICYGDLLGCAWTGTVHASSSTRTAARLRLTTAQDTIATGYFSVRLVWTSGAAVANNMTLLDLRDGTHTTAPRIYISGGILNVIYSGYSFSHATAIAANTTYVLHLVFDGVSFELYVNGVASGNASTPTTLGTLGPYLYIGTDYSATNHCNGTFNGAALYSAAMTANQVALDHDNVSPMLSASERVDSIPWLWVKDGDAIVDNANDSTYDNWAVIGGVPGTSPAKLDLKLTLSPTATALYLARMECLEFIDPGLLYYDLSGTVDATASGGQYKTDTVTTSITTLTFAPSTPLNQLRELMGREFTLFARMKDAGSNLLMTLSLPDGSNPYVVPQTLASAFSIVRGPSAVLPDISALPIDDVTQSFGYVVQMKRSTGSANTGTDFLMVAPRPIMKIVPTAGTVYYYGTTLSLSAVSSLTGDDLDLEPEQLNVILSFISSASSAPIDNTLSYDYAYITPRYGLL